MTQPQPVPDSALHRLRRSYALLMLLTYTILVDQGIIRAPEEANPPKRWFQAAEPLPDFQ